MAGLIETAKFIIKYRKELTRLKNGIWNLKVNTSEALSDGKITKEEAVDLLRETNTLLDDLITMLE